MDAALSHRAYATFQIDVTGTFSLRSDPLQPDKKARARFDIERVWRFKKIPDESI
jgi:hypothetical protein